MCCAAAYQRRRAPKSSRLAQARLTRRQWQALSLTLVNKAITLEKGKPNSLFQDGGTAIVIHAKKDDYVTDPAGNAGDQIACGVIK
jgi:Cu/Zn superoxide dismutase